MLAHSASHSCLSLCFSVSLSLFDAIKMALDYNARASFPKWVAGVPWLSVAMAVLICDSQQPTVPSRDFRAVEPLEKLLFSLWERVVFVP